MGQCSGAAALCTLQWPECLRWKAIPDPLVHSWVSIHRLCLQTSLLPRQCALCVGVLVPATVVLCWNHLSTAGVHRVCLKCTHGRNCVQLFWLLAQVTANNQKLGLPVPLGCLPKTPSFFMKPSQTQNLVLGSCSLTMSSKYLTMNWILVEIVVWWFQSLMAD